MKLRSKIELWIWGSCTPVFYNQREELTWFSEFLNIMIWSII